MSKLFVDCHIHTPLCGHATGEPEEYVRAAAAKGLKIIAFTCHSPMESLGFGGPRIRMDFQQLPEYLAMIDRATALGDTLGVEVLRGIEAEWFPEEKELAAMDRMLASVDFDYVIGSIHPHLPIYLEWFAAQGIRNDTDKLACYWEHASRAVSSGRYDTLAHADVIRCHGTVNEYTTAGHEPAIRHLLKTLAETGVCIEANTSGLGRLVKSVHPEIWILAEAAALGVKLAVGSDAHRPEAVSLGYPEVGPMLAECGWNSVHFFKNRKIHSFPFQTIWQTNPQNHAP